MTNFAYFKENERGGIKPEILKQNIGINLTCGYFSYAEIPKKYLKRIGVTGTLET